MAGRYPYLAQDRLYAAPFDSELSSSPGTTPPSSTHGNSTRGKLWLDTSVSPPALRVCAVPTASSGYVPAEWFTLAQKTTGGGGSDIVSNGGTINGPLTTTQVITAPDAHLTIATVGGVTFPGSGQINTTGAVSLGGTTVASLTSTGIVGSTGPNAALGFTDRSNGQQWLWYATGGSARLWMSGDKAIIDTSGNMTLAGTTLHLANSGGGVNGAGGPLIYGDSANVVIKSLGSTLFQNSGGTNVVIIDASGNITGGLITGTDAHLGVGTVGGSSFSGGSISAPGNIGAGGSLFAGGCQWFNNAGWMQTPQPLRTTSDLNVSGGAAIGGAISAPAFNGGNFNGTDHIVNGWLYGGAGARLTIAAHPAPQADGGYYCGLADAAWAAVESYAYYTKSSAELKTSIKTVDPAGALDAVLQLRPVTFRYKNKHIPGLHAGLIAEEVQQTLDLADAIVREGSVAYQQLIPLLCAAFQRLAERLENLEKK